MVFLILNPPKHNMYSLGAHMRVDLIVRTCKCPSYENFLKNKKIFCEKKKIEKTCYFRERTTMISLAYQVFFN